MSDEKSFAASHPGERSFFLAFLAIAWLGILIGFFPASWGRLQGRADYPAPLILHIHAVSFLVWMILLTVQIALIRRGNLARHRGLGPMGMALVPVMVLSGFFAEGYSQRFYLTHPPDSQAFFIIPLFYVVAFGVLATIAFARRRESAVHKRFVFLATALICGAAWARALGAQITGLVGDGFWGMIANTFFATNVFMAALLVFDWRTRGRLLTPVVLAVAAILAAQLAVSWTYHSPAWLPVARSIAEAVPGPPL